ncbi:MAG TPA: 2-C-methyl-D-erythritol 4-phosphate cytidylyltransferase [Fibrobacteres bacterium]|jgi:2-C-methyl-D-erythritol 4-phosphate cytidylyltransferase|nr:2-C-methyl-D-erythritol 4-phosphate cytidylyltransferase [Fibrobacterota bacterium]
MTMPLLEYDAIIVAGGAGARLGAPVPKAFVNIGDKPMLLYSMEQFDKHESVRSIVLVVPAEMNSAAKKLISGMRFKKSVLLVDGGKERWQSVKNGVDESIADWVLVHDAARPFVTHAVVDAVLEKTKLYDAVITANPEVDTIRTYKGDRAMETVDRTTLVRVGTPQVFRASVLKDLLSKAGELGIAPTDEAMLMEMSGIPVGIAWGDPLNFKITTQSDLVLAEALCKSQG